MSPSKDSLHNLLDAEIKRLTNIEKASLGLTWNAVTTGRISGLHLAKNLIGAEFDRLAEIERRGKMRMR